MFFLFKNYYADVRVCVFQDVILDFSPGPISAEDGDRGINTSLMFSIVSG